MSLMKSTAALPKGQIVRWIVPAAVYPLCSTTPGFKVTGLWARRKNPPQVRHSQYAASRNVIRPKEPAKWESLHAEAAKPPKWQKPRERLLFSQEDVPPLELWEAGVASFKPEGLTPEACLHAATQYCSIAINSLSNWKGRLERDYAIDNFTLHCMGVILTHFAEVKFGRLGWHMLKTASDLNYDPSTVTVMNVLSMLKDRGAEAESQLKIINPRFEKILRSGDPEALTVQGKILLKRVKRQEALACFDRAIKAAALKEQSTGTPTAGSVTATVSAPADRAPRWPTEAECYMRRAEVLLELGRREEARDALKVVALELDDPLAYHLLAQLTPEGSQEQGDYFLKAAVSGVTHAFPHLVRLEAKKAMALDPGDPQRKDHHILAAEWALLAKSQ
ncbi:hypothetical protein V8F33_004254 [Rhypophila sp. PSN 637]